MNGSAARPLVFELDQLVYKYNKRHTALDGVSLRIHAGEHVALLGANGCGKSTLLKILNGLLPPSGGSLRIFGEDVAVLDRDVDSAHRFHRQVGLVFQDPDIQLFMPTVGDDVAFGPLQLQMSLPDVRRRVEAALEQMAILHLRDRAPFELSGGEKKRAAIASVLSLEPEVLLLDEPTASLDPRTKWVLVNLIQQLGAQGKTIITATHELEIVPIIADRVVVIGEERRILADGPVAEIIEDYPLLIRANLIHAQLHRHGIGYHAHAEPDETNADRAGQVEAEVSP